MSDRISQTVMPGAPAATVTGPPEARLVIIGQTERGPTASVTAVRSLGEYRARYGARAGGTAMHDAAEQFLAAGAGELIVLRAAGPHPVAATAAVGTDEITVTARDSGAYPNAWTAKYTSATKTLTITKGTVDATYTGTDAETLAKAASFDRDVVVTVKALPGSDVAAVTLTGGTDDYSSADWEALLTRIPSYVEGGAIATPGTDQHDKLAAFAKTAKMFAIIGSASGDDDAAIAGKQKALAALGEPGQFASYAYPRIVRDDGTVLDPVGRVAALRALAIGVGGPGTSPIVRRIQSHLPAVSLETPVTQAQWRTLEALGVIVFRQLRDGVGLDSYGTAVPLTNNPNLRSGAFCDLVNAVRVAVEAVLDRFVGFTGTPAELTQIGSEVAGAVEAFRDHLVGEVDASGRLVHPGYRVSVDRGPDPADNRITCHVALRLGEEIDWVDFSLSIADASQDI